MISPELSLKQTFVRRHRSTAEILALPAGISDESVDDLQAEILRLQGLLAGFRAEEAALAVSLDVDSPPSGFQRHWTALSKIRFAERRIEAVREEIARIEAANKARTNRPGDGSKAGIIQRAMAVFTP